MRFAFASVAALAVSVAAAPTKRAVTDTDILNYALTLEFLENRFYADALGQFDQAAFAKAGFEPWVRNRFAQIGQHEGEHVKFLQAALGSKATAECKYKFPYTDVTSFVGLSAVLENGGVSAYLGAAQFITNKAYLTAAGSILTTEARHQGWVSSAVSKGAAWSRAFDTPLDFDQIFSIVSPFITSCPSSNPALPVKAFTPATYKLAGNKITLDFKWGSGDAYLVLYSGLTVNYYKLDGSRSATLPSGLQGTIFGIVSTSPNAASDANTVAGPIILSYPVPSTASN